MKKTALTAMFLLAALTVGTLVSCGSNDPVSDPDTETLPVSDDGGEPNESQMVINSLKKADHGGMEVRILGYSASQSYNDSEFYFADQTGDVIDDALFRRNQETEQQLGIRLVYDIGLSEADAVTRFRSCVTAGDDAFDTFIIKAVDYGTLITSNTLRSWDDIDGLQLDQPWYIKSANETASVGNSIYAVFSEACGTNDTMCWLFTFNKRLLSDLDLEDPYELVRSGKWTMDKLTELTRGIWQDLNGNNTPDEPDLFGLYTDSFATLDAMMIPHGIRAVKKSAEDYPEVDFWTDKLISSFDKTFDLYWNNDGAFVITKEPYTYLNAFNEGRGVFSPTILNYLIGAGYREMKDDYGILPYPKLDEDQKNYFTHLLGRTGIFLLPKTLSDEKAAVIGDVVDVLSAYSYLYLRPAIYDVSLNAKGVRDTESYEMLDIVFDGRIYDFSMFLESSGKYPFTPMYAYRNQLSKQKKDIASYYEANLKKAEDFLASLSETLEEID